MNEMKPQNLAPTNLISPPTAQTDNSIALLWDKPAQSSEIACYRIYVNGNLHGICTATDYTVTCLEPSTEFTFFVYSDTYDLDAEEEANEGTPVIQNIFIKNIVLDTYGGNAVFLAGLPKSPLQNIHLENVNAIGKYGLKAYNIQGFVMKNVSVVSRNDEHYRLYLAE